MSTTLVAYADDFDSNASMAWGWLWANIDGRHRWHNVHTFEDAESGHVRVRFINIESDGDDFTDDAQGYDGAPFVAHMPPGHTASWWGEDGATRRVQIWWGDGSNNNDEWRHGSLIAAKAARAFDRLMALEGDTE